MTDHIHITTDEEWQKHFEQMGSKAKREGLDVLESPYPDRSRAHAAWVAGWKTDGKNAKSCCLW